MTNQKQTAPIPGESIAVAAGKRYRVTDKGRVIMALGLALECIESGDLDVATSEIKHAYTLVLKLECPPTVDGKPA